LTIAVVLLCVAVKLMHSGMPLMMQHALAGLVGAVPAELSKVLSQPQGGWTDRRLASLFSALFMHSSWLHLTGNMVYLWVFGIPLERRLGWAGMLFVFLFGGALANLMVTLRVPDLASPIIGASGAVSAVVGAYLGLFPARRIGMLLPLGLYLQFARVPAILVIGSWFTLQLVYTMFGPITGVVAWWTHLAGFALGLIFALLVRARAMVSLGGYG
jgi:membrane associated rhomboid family serine protease